MSRPFARSCRQLFAWNWLPALYAHPLALQRVVPGAEQCEALRLRSQRMCRGLSWRLLQGLGLECRFLRERLDSPWPLATPRLLHALVWRVAAAGMSLVVREAVDRREVLRVIALLGQAGRDRALDDAARWPAMGAVLMPAWRAGQLDTPQALYSQGAGILSGLLESRFTGMRERFELRFAPESVRALELLPEQRRETLDLLADWERAALPNGWDASSLLPTGDAPADLSRQMQLLAEAALPGAQGAGA